MAQERQGTNWSTVYDCQSADSKQGRLGKACSCHNEVRRLDDYLERITWLQYLDYTITTLFLTVSQFWQFYWFRPQGSQDMASTHKKTHISKTLANLWYSLGKIRPLHTPQHTQDEAVDDVDRNKHFNDQEPYLFLKLKKEDKWNLPAGAPKNLAVIMSKCPRKMKHLSVCQKCKRRHSCVKQWNRPEIRIMEIFQLPTIKSQAPRYKPCEQSQTHAKRMRKR